MKRRAAGALVLGCAALLGLSGPSCGGDTEGEAARSDAGGPDGHVADAPGDASAESSPDADGATACQHRDECDAGGAACENACGMPCVCKFFVTRLEWRCAVPIVGSLCDPEEHPQCFYPPDTQTDGILCTCEAPAGEYFWSGGCKGESVCPQEPPMHGASCAGIVPLGIGCYYWIEDAGLDRACYCELTGSKRLWSCFPP